MRDQKTPRRSSKSSRSPKVTSESLKIEDSIRLEDIKVSIKFLNSNQEKLHKSILKNELTICIGPPGTAKTFVSCYSALHLLLSGKYEKIYLIKSVTPLHGEEIGFLKGSLDQKMDPHLMSFKMNLKKLLKDSEVDELFKQKKIESLPLAFVRGTSLDNCLLLCDESQNYSPMVFKTILTRLGNNSKMIILGDTKQIDLKKKSESILKEVFNMFADLEGIGKVEFTLDDVVRNPLIALIEKKFEDTFGI